MATNSASATYDSNFLQRASRPESQPFPIGRKEWTARAFRAGQRRLQLVEPAEVELLQTGSAAIEDESAGVRGCRRPFGLRRTAAVSRRVSDRSRPAGGPVSAAGRAAPIDCRHIA
jgi:hypothetical protein